MSKFSDSTFYLAPSGYRETILFPQKPLSSIGHLSVGRASSATRTNAAGQVEDVCYNLIRYSEDFSNVAWGKTGSTVTTDLTTAPDNNLTADKIIESATTDSHFVQAATINFTGAVYTMSIYAKASERNILQLFFNGSVNVNAYANFDLTNGVVGGTGFGTAASITSVGNGWYRCIMTATVVSGALIPAAYYCLQTSTTATRAATYAGNGTSGLFIWGAQLVQGNLPKDYLYTSDRLNFPRVDYSDGSASLLLEPQRTNGIRNSTMVGASTSPSTIPTNWQLFNTLGLTVSVVGLGTEAGINYIDLNYNGTANSSDVIRFGFESPTQISASNGQNWSVSIYSKIISQLLPPTSYDLRITERTAIGVYVTSSQQSFTPTSTLKRFTFTSTLNGGVTVGVVVPELSVPVINGTSYNFTIRIAQPQMELGAFVTTPIFTYGSAAVTRLADTFTRNNIYTNNLISSSGGTWFFELKNNFSYVRDAVSSNSIHLDTTTGGITNGFSIIGQANGRIRLGKSVASTSSVMYITTTDTFKAVIKWNGSTADVFVNGVKQVSATPFPVTAMEFFATGIADIPRYITQMALWNTPLSDSQCIELTGVAYTTPAQAYGSLNLVSESPDCLYTSVNTINRI
jgi:hypothetical protein